MRRVGPKAPVFSPSELLTIGNLFAWGLDTWEISRQMNVHESAVWNNLEGARAALARHDNLALGEFKF